MRRLGFTTFIPVILVWLVAAPAAAQRLFTPIEIDGGISAIGLTNEIGTREGSAGIGARVDFNIAPRIAIEPQLTWFPERRLPTHAGGGRTFELSIGVRAKFISRPQFSVYGFVAPGLLHFSDEATSSRCSTTSPSRSTVSRKQKRLRRPFIGSNWQRARAFDSDHR